MNGILLIDKPKGLTSHDVVNRLRFALRWRQIGHAGTLDPDATGLLVVCLGRATKVSSLLAAGKKIYRIGFELGKETDTYDESGTVKVQKEVNVSLEKLVSVLGSFQGKQMQRPPIYSAVKVRGRKLYEYARKGEAVDVPLREVTVHSLALGSFEPPRGEVEISCSKGTYVRSLIHDLGQKLGTGAITCAIHRIESGTLKLTDAIPLSLITDSSDPAKDVSAHLLSISEALVEVPRLRVSSAVSPRIVNGTGLGPAELASCQWIGSREDTIQSVLLVGEKGEALALGEYDGLRSLRVHRVL